MENIVCIKCNIEKPVDLYEFHYRNGHKFGRRKTCKLCRGKSRIRPCKPIASKFDGRFNWKKATDAEKMRHLFMVFESNYEKIVSGCWKWIGCKDKDGYGFMTNEKRRTSGHRISWLLYNGPIPNGLWVLHKCDNTFCVNPEHLFLGTPKDNFNDAVQKGRRVFKRGSECGHAILTERKVRNIKKLLINGLSHSIIAKKYRVVRQAISDIATGRNWKHVT